MQDNKSAVIIYSDIVGYNAQKIRDEDQAKSLLQKNSVLHRTLTQQYRGIVMKNEEDEIMAVFRNSTDAVQCAVAIQQGARNKGYFLRIGIHEGPVSIDENEVKGIAVSTAEFLQGISEKGGITVTETVNNSFQYNKNITFEFLENKLIEPINQTHKIYKLKYPESENKIDKIQNLSRKRAWLPFIILGIVFLIFLILTLLRKFL